MASLPHKRLDMLMVGIADLSINSNHKQNQRPPVC